jgi:hypothetical protein
MMEFGSRFGLLPYQFKAGEVDEWRLEVRLLLPDIDAIRRPGANIKLGRPKLYCLLQDCEQAM